VRNDKRVKQVQIPIKGKRGEGGAPNVRKNKVFRFVGCPWLFGGFTGFISK